jgi:hypothetical protein
MVIQGDALGLDGNTALSLDIHRIQDLLVHLPGTQSTTMLDKPIRQGRFAMVNMGDNRKIADVTEVTHAFGPNCGGSPAKPVWREVVCHQKTRDCTSTGIQPLRYTALLRQRLVLQLQANEHGRSTTYKAQRH